MLRPPDNLLAQCDGSGKQKRSTTVMDHASVFGYLPVLDRRSSGLELKRRSGAMDSASKAGNLEVLDCYELVNASGMGHLKAFEWWKSSRLELRWSCDSMDNATSNGSAEVLDWWKTSSLEPKWSEMLDWWKSSVSELKWSFGAMDDDAFSEKRVNVLDWWKSSGLELKWSTSSMDSSSSLKQSGLEMK
ncbi:hypothetical protein BJ742DRAFT_849336 [Cladochytrium replicatum]|nr:hypothetical protein BJ742DRAFT_849336 [Cladochytrium replicatum]